MSDIDPVKFGLLPLTPIQQMFVGCGIAVCITLLRIVTTTPISEK